MALTAVAPKKVVAKEVTEVLLSVTILDLVRQVLEVKVGMSTVYADVSSMASTCRTRLNEILLADLLPTNQIALLVKLGSRDIALLEVHAETGILLIVDGMRKGNAQLVKIAYSSTAAEQESSRTIQLNLLRKQRAKPKQKVRLKQKLKKIPVLLMVQSMKMKFNQ